MPMVLPSLQQREPILPQPRNIAIVATTVAFACMLAIAPVAAFGDDSHTTPAISPETVAAMEVREEVAEVNEFAQEEAPPAVGRSCEETLDVRGIGDTCVTADGLLRVEQADGRSHTIHGMDAPPTEAGAFAPSAQTAVNGADVSDISCVPASEPHYVLVYARPGNVTSRYSTVAPKLRSEVYKVGAFIDSESRSVDPGASRRLPMRCEGGAPTVLQATFSGLASGSASFRSIVDAFVAQGYQYNGGNERYIVYYDSPSPSGAAGTGHVFTTDSSASATNENNKGGLYAIEYRYANGGALPHWEVLVHEIIHTMGGVTNAAANTTGGGHCTDGQDVMCYADGTSTSYRSSVCATKVLDCNRNDYFNPSPAAGSFLATHWNVAASYNRFLIPGAARDSTAPSAVAGLAVSGASNSAIGLTWSPSSDDSGAPSYDVAVRQAGGAWRPVVSTARTSASIAGLAASTAYEIGVTAKDSSGNAAAQVILAATTNTQADVAPPAAPSGLRVKRTTSSATFSWNEAGDNVAVADYELRRLTPSASNPSLREPRSAGTTPNTSITIPLTGLVPGKRVDFQVVARDGAANVSMPTTVSITLPKDVTRPTAPARVRVLQRAATTIMIQWTPSRDNVAVTKYQAYQLVGRRWIVRGTFRPNVDRLKLVKLRTNTAYTFRLVALDAAGNVSAPSRALVARTR